MRCCQTVLSDEEIEKLKLKTGQSTVFHALRVAVEYVLGEIEKLPVPDRKGGNKKRGPKVPRYLKKLLEESGMKFYCGICKKVIYGNYHEHVMSHLDHFYQWLQKNYSEVHRYYFAEWEKKHFKVMNDVQNDKK